MLTQRQRREAAQRLAESGFDSQRWFVVSHVREAAFRGNEDPHDFRNFSQHSILPIVSSVVSQGGQVVRLGTREQSRIPDTKGIFDYARSTARSGLVDMYLMEKSRYYVGSSSGPLSMAYAFGKPAFITNYVDFLVAGFRKTDMYIPKRVYSTQEHKLMSIVDFCKNAVGIWEPNSYWFVENSLDEIGDAFSDFQKYTDNGFELTPEDREIYNEWINLRRKTLIRIIAEPDRDDFSTGFKDVAASTLDAPSIMAPSYLRKYLFGTEYDE
jgi:putative glycosyltransferase (TIGR04372 family)